jgi:hypothetical protein
MTFNKNLPFEIIAKILDEINLEDQKTVLSCQLICRSWNQYMLKRIYRRVDLCNEHDENRFTYKIKHNPFFGELVQEISFHRWTQAFLLYQIYCPNFRSLHCSSSCDYFAELKEALENGA